MAADATLVKGAAAMAAAETAKTTGMVQGIAAGVAPVMAEWAKQKAEDKKLQKEMNQWSQRIEDQIITDDPALRDEAIKIRDQIATIATNKDLGRDEQRKQILKLRDDFVVSSGEFTRRKTAKAAYIKANANVGDNVSKAYDTYEGNEISKQLGDGSAKEVDGGWEFIIPARGNKEQYVLNVGTEELVNYAKKPADRATITSFQNLITSKNRQTEPGGEENSITSVIDSFNTLQKREILAEMEASIYVPNMSEEEVDIAFKQHVTNNIRAEKEIREDVVTAGEELRNKQRNALIADLNNKQNNINIIPESKGSEGKAGTNFKIEVPGYATITDASGNSWLRNMGKSVPDIPLTGVEWTQEKIWNLIKSQHSSDARRLGISLTTALPIINK